MPETPTTAESNVALAFETSADYGAVAIGRGPRILDTRPFTGPRRHAVEFIPAVADLCRTHGVLPNAVSQLYVSVGPGSFTGLRIGIAAARMIAFATGARLVAVPTFDAIAPNALTVDDPPDRVAVIVDAKRNRVYAAAYELQKRGVSGKQPRYVPRTEPVEADPAAFLAQQPRTTAVLGEGVNQHRTAVEASGLPILPESCFRPDVNVVYRLGHEQAHEGRFTDPRRLIPLYIRPPEAEEKWQR